MPNLPLPRFLEHHAEQRAHANTLTSMVRELDANLAKRTIVCDPSDAMTLRGIPAIGRGVAGAIRGTNPANMVDSPRRVASATRWSAFRNGN